MDLRLAPPGVHVQERGLSELHDRANYDACAATRAAAQIVPVFICPSSVHTANPFTEDESLEMCWGKCVSCSAALGHVRFLAAASDYKAIGDICGAFQGYYTCVNHITLKCRKPLAGVLSSEFPTPTLVQITRRPGYDDSFGRMGRQPRYLAARAPTRPAGFLEPQDAACRQSRLDQRQEQPGGLLDVFQQCDQLHQRIRLRRESLYISDGFANLSLHYQLHE